MGVGSEGKDGRLWRLDQGRGALFLSPLIFRLTILFPIPSPPPLLHPCIPLLWPVHLQPLSLGNKAEGFVYWRLEEK